MKRTKLACCGFEAIVYPENLFHHVIFHPCTDYQCHSFMTSYTEYDTKSDFVDEFGNVLDYDYVCQELKLACGRLQNEWANLNYGSVLDYAFCLHDQDRKPDGSYLKPHFHVYLWTDDKNDYPMTEAFRNSICMEFGHWIIKSEERSKRKRSYIHYYREVQTSLVNPIKKLHSALRYMIHIDNDTKHTYDLGDCCSSVNLFLHPAFKEATIQSEVTFLLDACKSRRVLNFNQLVDYAAEMGMMDIILKYNFLFTNYVRCLSGKAPDLRFGAPGDATNLIEAQKYLKNSEVSNG